MDSTYVIYKLLSETNDDVTAIVLIRGEHAKRTITPRREILKHVPNLIQELKKIRTFDVIFKVAEDNDYSDEIMHHWYTYLIAYAAPFLNEGLYDRVATGRTWEQFNIKVVDFIDPATNEPIVGNPTAFATQRLFDRLVEKGTIWKPLTTHDFHDHFTRWHAFKCIPDNIRNRTFSCFSPIENDYGNTPCGKCHKCLWDKITLLFIENGYTAEQLETYKVAKSIEYGSPGKTANMRAWLPLITKDCTDYWNGLDTKEKVQAFCRDMPYYTLPKDIPEGSIWDMSDISDIGNKPIVA
jgi:7-cyano-7-deazaguanine synthase in queuosine biosynthesis